MCLLGDVFLAEEGLSIGLVDTVVEKGRAVEAAREMGGRLISRGPLATQTAKMLINASEGEEQERVLETLAGGLLASNDELEAGVSAFRTKQKPVF